MTEGNNQRVKLDDHKSAGDTSPALRVIEGGRPRLASPYMQGRATGFRDGQATARADMADAMRGFAFALFFAFALGLCAGLLTFAIWTGSV